MYNPPGMENLGIINSKEIEDLSTSPQWLIWFLGKISLHLRDIISLFSSSLFLNLLGWKGKYASNYVTWGTWVFFFFHCEVFRWQNQPLSVYKVKLCKVPERANPLPAPLRAPALHLSPRVPKSTVLKLACVFQTFIPIRPDASEHIDTYRRLSHLILPE